MVSAVYRGDEAKPSVQTCTCVHRTCNGYGVTGDRYGVGQSHPQCDPCYPLVAESGAVLDFDLRTRREGVVVWELVGAGETHQRVTTTRWWWWEGDRASGGGRIPEKLTNESP